MFRVDPPAGGEHVYEVAPVSWGDPNQPVPPNLLRYVRANTPNAAATATVRVTKLSEKVLYRASVAAIPKVDGQAPEGKA